MRSLDATLPNMARKRFKSCQEDGTTVSHLTKNFGKKAPGMSIQIFNF